MINIGCILKDGKATFSIWSLRPKHNFSQMLNNKHRFRSDFACFCFKVLNVFLSKAITFRCQVIAHGSLSNKHFVKSYSGLLPSNSFEWHVIKAEIDGFNSPHNNPHLFSAASLRQLLPILKIIVVMKMHYKYVNIEPYLPTFDLSISEIMHCNSL